MILHQCQIVSSIGDQIRVKDNNGVFHIATKIINLRKKDKTAKRPSEMFGNDLNLNSTISTLRAAAIDYVGHELETKPHMKKDKVAIREGFVEILSTPSQDLTNLIRAHIKQHKNQIDAKSSELAAAEGGISETVKKITRMIGNFLSFLIVDFNFIVVVFFRGTQPVL